MGSSPDNREDRLIQAQAPKSPTATVAAPIATARGAPSASAIYEGFRAQRRELSNQLDELESTRRGITSQLEDMPAGSLDRKPLETRMTDIDSRITTVDPDASLQRDADIPGRRHSRSCGRAPTRHRGGRPPQEAYALGGIFMLVVLLPTSIAFSRRIWRRSAAAVAAFPREIGERLLRMEHALEATAVEVERIGEGQRFLTRLFTEGEGARPIGSGAAQPIERKSLSAPERLP